MKNLSAICWLCLALCGPALVAQSTLLSLASTESPEATAPLAPHSMGGTLAAPVGAASPHADFATLNLKPSFLAQRSMYEAVLPLPPDAVCTQAMMPLMLRQSEYAFERLQFSTSALMGTFAHDNLVKMARNFIPGQPLPDAPTYVPLTSRQKFDAFLHNIHTVGFGLGILTDSFISQATGAYPSFGGGMEGYGQRLGAAAAGETSAAFFSGFVFPTLLHQDPRYFRSHEDAISDRLAYAASRVVIGRKDNGHNVINLSVIMSQLVQAAVSNAYVPYRNESVSGTLENAAAGLGAVAQADILNEFWPDIKEFFSRHNPEALVIHHKSTDANADAMLANR